MLRILNLRNLLWAGLLAAGFGAAGPTPATACDHTPAYQPPPICRYVKVVSYRYERRLETRWVTVTDDDGCVQRYRITFTRTVRLPVVRWIRICE